MTRLSLRGTVVVAAFEAASIAAMLIAVAILVGAFLNLHAGLATGLVASLGLEPGSFLGILVFWVGYAAPLIPAGGGLWLARYLQSHAKRVRAREDARAPLLVLRSFREGSPAGLPAEPSSSTVWGTPIGGKERVSILEWVVRELSPLAVSIIVGPDDDFGRSARSLWEVRVNDDEWEKVVARLAERCRAVLLFPANSPGVLTEIEILERAGLLEITVVVMPPQRAAPRVDMAELWNTTARRLEERGYRLPPYGSSGTFYLPSRDLSASASADMTPGGAVAALSTLLDRIGSRGVPLRELLPSLLDTRSLRGS